MRHLDPHLITEPPTISVKIMLGVTIKRKDMFLKIFYSLKNVILTLNTPWKLLDFFHGNSARTMVFIKNHITFRSHNRHSLFTNFIRQPSLKKVYILKEFEIQKSKSLDNQLPAVVYSLFSVDNFLFWCLPLFRATIFASQLREERRWNIQINVLQKSNLFF